MRSIREDDTKGNLSISRSEREHITAPERKFPSRQVLGHSGFLPEEPTSPKGGRISMPNGMGPRS